jgi:hypothetical protein
MLDAGSGVPPPVSWFGPATTLSLIVVATEHDDGDPNAYRDVVNFVVAVAVLVSIATGAGLPWTVAASGPAAWLINKTIGSADDVISEEYLTLEPSQLLSYAGTAPSREKHAGNIPHHFFTTHKGSGAEYRVLFGVRSITR